MQREYSLLELGTGTETYDTIWGWEFALASPLQPTPNSGGLKIRVEKGGIFSFNLKIYNYTSKSEYFISQCDTTPQKKSVRYT